MSEKKDRYVVGWKNGNMLWDDDILSLAEAQKEYRKALGRVCELDDSEEHPVIYKLVEVPND